MLGGGASMAIASIWTSMVNWSTPTILFCVLNFVIAIIFIASNSKSSTHHRINYLPSQLARSPSLLERVKSVNLSSHDHNPDQNETAGYNSVTQLSRPPSFLQRLKSIDFSFSSFYTTHPDQSHDSYQHESKQTRYDSASQLARAPSLLERVKSINFSSYIHSYNPIPTESEQLSNLTDEPAERVPSLLDRVKSFKLTPSFNSDHHSGDKFSSHDQHSDMNVDPHHDSVKGSSIVTGDKLEKSGENPAKKSRNLTISRREKWVAKSDNIDEDMDGRRPATSKATIGARNESVDAKADDFIKRFKQQLKLQRIDSLKKFREMLNRGT